MEEVGQPTLIILARFGHTRIFHDTNLLSHFVPDPTTGGIIVLEDNGLAAASDRVNRFTTIVGDTALRRILERGFVPPTENASEEDGEGALNDCPGWVVVSSCVGCAACAPVGEIPPPCWAACATCAYCGVAWLESAELPENSHICGSPCTPGLPHCGGSYCFGAGTLVHTPSGPRAIESLAVGDEVYSAEPVLGRVVVRRVRELESYEGEYPLVTMTFGASGASVYTTPGHHFLTPNGWAQAGTFSGEPVATRTGNWLQARLDESRGVMTADRVYNLVLDEPGGFFVGVDGAYASANGSAPGDP